MGSKTGVAKKVGHCALFVARLIRISLATHVFYKFSLKQATTFASTQICTWFSYFTLYLAVSIAI